MAHALEVEALEQRESLQEHGPLSPEAGLEDVERAVPRREVTAHGALDLPVIAGEVAFGQEAARVLHRLGDALGDVTPVEAIARRIDGLLAAPGQALLLGLDYGGVPHRAGRRRSSWPEETQEVNINLPKTSVIEGTISYSGAQTGRVRVGLFADPSLTEMRYSIAYPREGESLAFPLHYSSRNPAPDTQGVMPGAYYIAAFIDSNPNGVRDGGEATGAFGASWLGPRPRR